MGTKRSNEARDCRSESFLLVGTYPDQVPITFELLIAISL